MRIILFAFLISTIVFPAYSTNLGPHAPEKTNTAVEPNIPIVPRQGGDTVDTAFPIESIPFDTTGTTTGFNDDYDGSCPVEGLAPDVVYSYTPDTDLLLTVDLFGSQYDTKVYIFDELMQDVACDDDYYEDYTSKIVAAELFGGTNYYIIVDGYDNLHGDYIMHIEEYHPCEIPCPADAARENEPLLVDNYIDAHNGGCNSLEMLDYAPFQPIENSVFCGTTGWFDFNWDPYRDTDWYTAIIPENGILEVSGIAELPTNIFELGPLDCGSVAIVQQIQLFACEEQTMIINGEPGAEIWLWVGPPIFEPPSYFWGSEYNYTLFTNIQNPVSTQRKSWGNVKALYR